MGKKDLTTTINVKIINMDDALKIRLRQILGRDTRIIRKYLNIIDRHRNHLIKIKKQKKNEKHTIDTRLLDDMTLETEERLVKYNMKSYFPRISTRELIDCRETAVAMYDSYLELRRKDKTHKRPGLNKKGRLPRNMPPRRFTLDIEDKTLTLIDSMDTSLQLLNDKTRKKIKHNRIVFDLDLHQYHIDKIARGEVKALKITWKEGKIVAHFSIVETITYNVHKTSEIGLVGIDLGISRDAVIAVFTQKGLYDQIFITNPQIEATKRSLESLNERIDNIQRDAKLSKNNNQPSDGKYLILRNLRHSRKQLKNEINHQIANEIVSKVKNIASKFDIYISVGKLRNLRKKHRKGNGRKKLRKLIHSWSYFTLTRMLKYKLKREGLEKRFLDVNEAYTSSRCWKCNKRGKRPKQSQFFCSNATCLWRGNADLNGAINIAKRGINYFNLKKKFNSQKKNNKPVTSIRSKQQTNSTHQSQLEVFLTQ